VSRRCRGDLNFGCEEKQPAPRSSFFLLEAAVDDPFPSESLVRKEGWHNFLSIWSDCQDGFDLCRVDRCPGFFVFPFHHGRSRPTACSFTCIWQKGSCQGLQDLFWALFPFLIGLRGLLFSSSKGFTSAPARVGFCVLPRSDKRSSPISLPLLFPFLSESDAVPPPLFFHPILLHG